MYDYGITYYCLFPGGGGPTSLKSVADKIYALGKKMHDETGDNQDGADDDESPKKAAGLSIDQGDQLKDPAEHNTDSSPVIASPEQGEKENSTLVTFPSTIASKIKQILNGKNEKYGVVQALDPHSLDQEPEEETVCGVRKGWIEKKCRRQSLDLGYAVSSADIQ